MVFQLQQLLPFLNPAASMQDRLKTSIESTAPLPVLKPEEASTRVPSIPPQAGLLDLFRQQEQTELNPNPPNIRRDLDNLSKPSPDLPPILNLGKQQIAAPLQLLTSGIDSAKAGGEAIADAFTPQKVLDEQKKSEVTGAVSEVKQQNKSANKAEDEFFAISAGLSGGKNLLGDANKPIDLPSGNVDSSEIDQIRQDVADLAPTAPDPESDDLNKRRKLALLLGIAQGVQGRVNIGDILLGAGIGGLSSQLAIDKEVADKQTKAAQALRDFKTFQINTEFKLRDEEKRMRDENKPKLHNTKDGLFIQRSVRDDSGNITHQLVPFNGSAFGNITNTLDIAKRLGLTDDESVAILGRDVALNSKDPFAMEQLQLALLDNSGLLDSVLGDVLNGDAMQEEIQRIKNQAIVRGAEAGEVSAEVHKFIITRLTFALAHNDALREQAWEVLSNRYNRNRRFEDVE